MADDRAPSRNRISGAQIQQLFAKHDQPTANEVTEIERTRALIARELRPDMPDELSFPAQYQGLGIALPDATVVPLQTVNRIGKRRPRIKRPTKGVSPRRLLQATKVEQPLNALMMRLYPWPLTVDLVTNEAQCAVITQIDATHWSRRPKREQYNIDAEGRGPKDSYYRDGKKTFRKSEKASAAAYEEDLREYQAAHPPFIIRAFSRRECVPINPRQVGTRWEVDGLIVKQKFTRTDIARRLIWDGMDRLLAEDPQGEVTVFEAWLTDVDAETGEAYPYVAYHVEGGGSTKVRTAEGDAEVIDLKQTYGICRLPIAYRYGLSFPGAEAGKRGVPLMAPFASALLLEDSMASAKAVHANNFAFGGWFQTLDPSAGADAHLDADGGPLTVDVRPNSVTLLPPGALVPAVHPGTNHDVQELIQLTRGVVDQRAPDTETEGAGYAQLISRSGVSESLDQIYDALKELYEMSASFLLEALAGFGERHGAVVVALDEDRSAWGEAGEPELVDVEPSLAGGNFRVLAVDPPQENLPLRQQEAEFVERKLMTRREFHERRGVEDPEQYEAELLVEEYLADPERGRPEIWKIAAEITKDEQMLEQQKLLEQERITANGDPMAAIQAGLLGPPPGMAPGGAPMAGPGSGQPMTGMGSMSPAQAQLAGIIGGGMQAGAMGQAMSNGAVNPGVPGGI